MAWVSAFTLRHETPTGTRRLWLPVFVLWPILILLSPLLMLLLMLVATALWWGMLAQAFRMIPFLVMFFSQMNGTRIRYATDNEELVIAFKGKEPRES